MCKKALSIVALLAIATVAFANADWVGTYWGDDAGEWKGTIVEEQDPIRFEGAWANEAGENGELFAYGDIVGYYWVFEEGDILDEDGNVIGHWSGEFPMHIDAYITGPWETETGSGTWGGYRQ